MSGIGYIKLMKTELTIDLFINDTKAMKLLFRIAQYARYIPKTLEYQGVKINLGIGETIIGKKTGDKLKLTHNEYRGALMRLKKLGLVSTRVEKSRTIAKLLNSEVFDCNLDHNPESQPQTTTPETLKTTGIIDDFESEKNRPQPQSTPLNHNNIRMYSPKKEIPKKEEKNICCDFPSDEVLKEVYNSYPNRCSIKGTNLKWNSATGIQELKSLIDQGIDFVEIKKTIEGYTQYCRESETYQATFEKFVKNYSKYRQYANVRKPIVYQEFKKRELAPEDQITKEEANKFFEGAMQSLREGNR